MKHKTGTVATIVAALIALMATVAGVAPVDAAGFERGPTPTNAGLEASSGPFSVATTAVSDLSTSGFGAADIYYPTDTSQGTFGGVAVAPGFTATRSSLAWLARRVASHGFVVININTNSVYDQPASRVANACDQLALDE